MIKINKLRDELNNRTFVELKEVKIKKRNAELLEELKSYGVDIGAVIDLALEKNKLEKLVEDFRKEMKENNQNSTQNQENLSQNLNNTKQNFH